MDATCWNAAGERFDSAGRILDNMADLPTDSLKASISMWEEFVNELARGFNKLFHGEKKGDSDAAIFAKIRLDRKEDDLLVYLREARNEIEHGVEWVATDEGAPRKPQLSDGTIPLMGYTIVDEEGNSHEYWPDPSKMMIIDHWDFQLVALKAKAIPVPETHLGMPLLDKSPVAVGRLAVAYANERLEELRPSHYPSRR